MRTEHHPRGKHQESENKSRHKQRLKLLPERGNNGSKSGKDRDAQDGICCVAAREGFEVVTVYPECLYQFVFVLYRVVPCVEVNTIDMLLNKPESRAGKSGLDDLIDDEHDGHAVEYEHYPSCQSRIVIASAE